MCSFSSSSTNSPSAVSKSGGAIHSFGTTHGKATPILAARFNHPGPCLPVSFSHKYCVKWLQFLLRRLYDVPWKASEASLMILSRSAWGLTVKPCRISHLNVPPGGSILGLVQYTPVIPLLSCPPYAYSLPFMTTPECRRDAPNVQSTEEIFPG
jgi:hypothetical protein